MALLWKFRAAPCIVCIVTVLQQGEGVEYMKLMTRLLDVAIGRQYFKEYCKERWVP
jgi:hypothetical protein